MKRIVTIILLALALLVIATDAYRLHFDKALIETKIQNQSNQTHWGLWYGQKHVFYRGSFRYHDDIQRIKQLVVPESAVLSDLVTSYMLAAQLPVYVRNKHNHHGRRSFPNSKKLLDNNFLCFLDRPGVLNKAKALLLKDATASRKKNAPQIKYVVLNKDILNRNLNPYCLSRKDLTDEISLLAKLLYKGEFLSLYELPPAT